MIPDLNEIRCAAEGANNESWFTEFDLWEHGVTDPEWNDYIVRASPAKILAILDYIDVLEAERDAYRRGQGPAPTPATPGVEALHETHPIPNSRGDDQ